MKRFFRACGTALLALGLASSPARADGNTGLREAQKAYAAVDYEATRTLASEAVKRGGNDRAATAQLYLLWATAAAALDHGDEARTGFSFALATNPELKLDRNLSPKMRGPYLEARGALSGTDGKPPLEVTLQRRKRELELGLHDALQVADSMLLATRVHEETPFVKQQMSAAPTKRVPTPQGSELQFFLQVLDRYGNVLFELGTEDEPRRLALVSSVRPPVPAVTRPESDASPVPYYVTAGALATLGLASGGVATAMYLRREAAARDWNGPQCEQPGATRGAQCSALDDRRKRAEYLAIGFTAAGGALLLGSLVSLVVAPASPRSSASVAVAVAPGNVILQLHTSL